MTTKHLSFLHQTYPAQFGPIIQFLLKNYDVKISYLTQYLNKAIIPGCTVVQYKPAVTQHEKTPYFFSRHFEEETASMHGCYDTFFKAGLTQPDIMVGHVGMGTLGLFHERFPETKTIGYFEIFYDKIVREFGSRPEYRAPLPNRTRVPLRNATQLVELQECFKGYTPTAFQRSTFPKEYQYKLAECFDGVDTVHYQPSVVSENSELKQSWPNGVKIVTYVARGLEAMRGFDYFMEMAYEICQKRDDVHFVIAGNPRTCYGSEMIHIKDSPTFKDHVLKQKNYDLSRFHFLEWISESALADLYRISDCHFYWTVAHTLSWSLFQGLSTGALVVASDSLPVRDLIQHEVNGLLMPQYDLNAYVEQVLEILDQPEKFQHLRENARQTVLEKYSFDVCLPKLAEFYFSDALPHPQLNPYTVNNFEKQPVG